MNNILGLFIVLTALIIQGWMSIFHLATDDITYVFNVCISASTILFITGIVYFADKYVNRIFAVYSRINYVIAFISLVGLSILLVFRGYFENLLFPRTAIIYFLILDLFFIFLLGLFLLNRFKTKANTTSATN